MPDMALMTLVFLFGFYAIANGVVALIAGFRRHARRAPPPQAGPAVAQEPWWALLIEGGLGIIAGLIALFMPGITAIALLFLIAGWAIATGIMEIVAAIRLRQQIRGEWLLALMGVLSIVFGVLVAMYPGAGALAVLLWIGAYAIVFGALLIALGVKLRKLVHEIEHHLGDQGFSAATRGHQA